MTNVYIQNEHINEERTVNKTWFNNKMYFKLYTYTEVFLIFFTALDSLETFDFLFPPCLDEGWPTLLIDTKFFLTFGFSLFSWFSFVTLFDLKDVKLVLSVLGLKKKKENY